MYCPKCKKEVGVNDRFCQVCGTRTIQRQHCTNCGEPLDEGMLFCPECGQAVKMQPVGRSSQNMDADPSAWQGSSMGENAQELRPSSMPKGKRSQPLEPAGGSESYWRQSEEDKPTEKRGIPLVVVVGIFVGILLIFVGIFVLFRFTGSEQTSSENAQVQEEGETDELTVVITPKASETSDTSADESESGLEEPVDQVEEEPEAEEKTFVGAKGRVEQQEVVTTGGQLDLQHMGNLLTNTGATYGTYVLDLTNQQEYDGGGADSPLPASALIGVPILFTIADGVDKGTIDLDTPVIFRYTFENGRGIFKSADDGKSFPVSQLLSEALTNSDNNALNSLMDFLTVEEINDTCHAYGFTSVDIQRKLMVGSSDLENYISAKDAAMMLNAVYQDNFTGIGKAFLESNFKISAADTANQGMYPACAGCDTFLNLNGITDSRYNEIGLIQNGDEVFILSVLTCNGDAATSAAAVTTLTSYVMSTLQAQ